MARECLPIPRRVAVRAGLLALLAIAAALIFAGAIDKGAAAIFYVPGRGFPAADDGLVTALRSSTRATAYGVGLFLLFALFRRVLLGRPLWGLSRAAVVYLLAVFLLGPGLLVNGILKEVSGRARPFQVVEFGGARHFSPPFVIADQCPHNCSFVSGEASLGFAFLAFGFAARTPRHRRLGFAAGLALGCGFGLLRMAEGAHFLSDVYFAGLLMAGLAWLLHHWLIECRWLDRLGLWPAAPG